MGNQFAGSKEHSAEYFGETRDFWWNPEYLEWVLHRINFPASPNMLDLGCGVGHWGRAIIRAIKGRGSLMGVDREAKWVGEARSKFPSVPNWQTQFQESSAESLPFDDEFFDVVTCQTLLIHVADARAVVKEMLRVLKPGGMILLAEPNNALSPVVAELIALEASHEATMALIDFHLTCLRGKRKLGLGDETIGEKLPGLLGEFQVEHLTVGLNEKVNFMAPPYAASAQKAQAEEIQNWATREFWIWSKEDTKRYFEAGEGDDFPFLWTLAKSVTTEIAARVKSRTYTTAGAGTFYLISGRKKK